MTNSNTAPAWPQRFGTLTKVQVKTGRRGRYAILTVDCKKFTQTAFAFGDKLIAQIIAAGEGSKVWLKGPIEAVQRDGYSEDQMKVVYFKDKSAQADETAEAEAAAPAPVEPQDLTAIKGIGEAVAAKLNAAGVETYAALAKMTDEDLDGIGAGTAKRATTADWRGQAAALHTAADSARLAAASTDEIDSEIPF